MTKVRVPKDTHTINLTAVLGSPITLQYDGDAGGKFIDKQLEAGEDVTLDITSSDASTSIVGKYRTPPGSGAWNDFSTNDAVTISQDFSAPSGSGASTEFQFKVSTSDGTLTGDPILLLKTAEPPPRR